MRKYAEVHKGRMLLAFNADKQPEFASNREAVDITDEIPEPKPGWLWDGNTWTESTAPPPVVKPPSLLEQIDAKLDKIIAFLTPGPP